MSLPAEEKAGLNGEVAAKNYRTASKHVVGSLETWPLLPHQRVGEHNSASAQSVARVMLRMLLDGKTSCRVAQIPDTFVLASLIDRGIVKKECFADSQAWFCAFTAYTKSWCAWILSLKPKEN